MIATIKGLDTLKRRFQARGLAPAVTRTLRHEAETIAADAARAAPGRLGETVEVTDESRGDRLSFAIGTAHRAGRFLEHGTVRHPRLLGFGRFFTRVYRALSKVSESLYVPLSTGREARSDLKNSDRAGLCIRTFDTYMFVNDC